MEAFGEDNVQTAKHYGNLGRLYQSMGRYQVSEPFAGISWTNQIVFLFFLKL